MIKVLRNQLFTILKQGDQWLRNIQSVKQIAHFRKVPLFLIDADDRTFYLVQSAQDETLLNWLKISGNKLTVLKEHFTDFYGRFLNRLSECYDVTYQPYNSTKKVLYSLDEVIKLNSLNNGE